MCTHIGFRENDSLRQADLTGSGKQGEETQLIGGRWGPGNCRWGARRPLGRQRTTSSGPKETAMVVLQFARRPESRSIDYLSRLPNDTHASRSHGKVTVTIGDPRSSSWCFWVVSWGLVSQRAPIGYDFAFTSAGR